MGVMVGRRGARADEEFDAFFYAMRPAIMRLALRLSGDWFVSEDVTAEAFARAFARWPTVRELEHRDAWVMRVASNLAIDVIRRRRGPTRPLQHLAGEVTDPADVAVLRLSLAAALAALPKSQREAAVLRYIADLSEADVAAALGVATGTVKSHLHRARSALGSSFDFDMEGV